MTGPEALRLFVAFRLCRLGTPGAYLACLLAYGPRDGHRHWQDRKSPPGHD